MIPLRGKALALLLVAVLLTACAHYSTTHDRSETENTIMAPIDTVWKVTHEILPPERITIQSSDKNTYTIVAKKAITLASAGDDITIKLYARNPSATIVHFEAHPSLGTTWIGWGHQERMVKDIFAKIKAASERSN